MDSRPGGTAHPSAGGTHKPGPIAITPNPVVTTDGAHQVTAAVTGPATSSATHENPEPPSGVHEHPVNQSGPDPFRSGAIRYVPGPEFLLEVSASVPTTNRNGATTEY